jgi:hypothetical protein
MSATYNRVDISDKDGWRREFPLQKTITFIGSDPRNDVVLERHHGSGVEPRHLQLLALPGSAQYRLVNLGNYEVLLGTGSNRPLPPHASQDIGNSEVVRVGEFTLTFHTTAARVEPITGGMPVVGGVPVPDTSNTGNAIGLTLMLPATQLLINQALDGSIKVKNRGNKPGAQFKIELDGWPEDSYQMGPGPVLFPNAEKEIFFKLRYPQALNFVAGERKITVRVSAPEVYLGEQAIATQVIHVMPQYTHTLRLYSLDQK